MNYLITLLLVTIIGILSFERLVIKNKIKKAQQSLKYLENCQNEVTLLRRTIVFKGDSLKSLSDQVNSWLEQFPEIYALESNIQFYFNPDEIWYIFITYSYEKHI